ncbi:hypothetical protein K491DRAFT_13248 [Lophiostoma macrostomum CBS 122681]|uniref:Uncharacterized protein n=1 Tax=Lophiostoma macrostomum CBS 122681 TaxID=1314788 RepID=A0A6A6TSJ9_9PLEO|nr:hypothetical protein K491DRAFT_13248 [Lophiostoma macrostomum CBS 122681]
MNSRVTLNQWLSSRLASQTFQGHSSPSSLVSTSTSPEQTRTSPAETISSIKDGHTVYVTISEAPTPTATGQTGAQPAKDENTPVGAIAGGVVGVLALAGLALIAIWFMRRKKLAKQHRRATLPPPYTEPDMSAQLSRGESYS